MNDKVNLFLIHKYYIALYKKKGGRVDYYYSSKAGTSSATFTYEVHNWSHMVACDYIGSTPLATYGQLHVFPFLLFCFVAIIRCIYIYTLFLILFY